MKEEKVFYRRNLPHYQPTGAIFFITFRLRGSLPRIVLEEMKRENEIIEADINKVNILRRKNRLLNNQRKKYFVKFDELLNKSKTGPFWLRNKKVAKLVTGAIQYRDGKVYDLRAFCVMPNHVHMLFLVTRHSVSSSPNSVRTYEVTKILQELKKFTAREANKILNRSGQFWHRESYDHVIRSAEEFNNVINYILQNPVKAGLAKRWDEWKWNYVKCI